MTKNLILVLAALVLAACSGKKEEPQKEEAKPAKDYVEVIYFHGTQRCITCRSIEENTKELLESKFAEQLKDSTIVLNVVDFSKPENESLAEKYQVTWSSLFVIKHKGTEEQAENLTDFAFETSKNSPEEFKAEVEKTINEALK